MQGNPQEVYLQNYLQDMITSKMRLAKTIDSYNTQLAIVNQRIIDQTNLARDLKQAILAEQGSDTWVIDIPTDGGSDPGNDTGDDPGSDNSWDDTTPWPEF